MKKVMIALAAVVLSLSFVQTASAGCDANCRASCQRTANQMTVQQCIRLWSYIFDRYPTQVKAITNGYWTKDLCERKCQIVYQNFGYNSAAACIQAIPCNRY